MASVLLSPLASPPMRITLRAARAGDQPRLLAFMAAYYRFDGLPLDRDAAGEALTLLLSDASLGTAWFIEADGEPVGYVVLTLGFSLEYHGRDAFVDELFVEASHRGRGVGRAALAQVAEAARERGVRALHLEVEHRNEAAQAFYRTLGFQDHDRYLLTRRLSSARDG